MIEVEVCDLTGKPSANPKEPSPKCSFCGKRAVVLRELNLKLWLYCENCRKWKEVVADV